MLVGLTGGVLLQDCLFRMYLMRAMGSLVSKMPWWGVLLSCIIAGSVFSLLFKLLATLLW